MNDLKLRGQSLGLLTLLAVQFLLGMFLNLFVKLPPAHPGTAGNFGSRAWHSFIWAISTGGGIALTLHVLVAVGLLLGSVSLVVRAAAAKNRAWTALSIAGALGILTALTNGLAFLGYNKDASSFIMATGFIVATVAYTAGLSLAAFAPLEKPKRTKHYHHKKRVAYTH